MRAEFADAFVPAPVRDIPTPVYADYVLDALQGFRREGLRTALVTLVAVDGSSPRPPGSQIAVAENGRAVGAVTGGCAEAAIIRDAVDAIVRGRNHVELYGKGSRFKDIVLPCGSGVHLFFDTTLSDARLDDLIAARRDRRVTVYTCDAPQGTFERPYLPQRRLLVFGRGHIVPALTQVAHLNEYDVQVFCPDATTRDLCRAFATAHPLTGTSGWDETLLDPFAGVVSLFHDHDFEPDILSAALRSPAFYIGALGSSGTHAKRLEALSRTGWNEADLTRISGPVGLYIGARTPPEIALSIMAEVVRRARATS
ncbi:XdhC family protein [Asticcacaulis sp. YBE204]|uniref:XdhC family protein n=1 Tax=Asticcacaulis sp. YBE204 TaxID=1282363 RepID=UPI0003C3B326|nr:XdhC family protein [Asticcacaulis sp. YBE204]ESQ79051.1 hypothetical protein AEYBE204_11545 [Asticcacaulis sp. YBE204]